VPRVETITSLQPGDRVLVGGDKFVRVPDELAARFRPGDAVVVVEATGEILHLPAAERLRATDAVTRATEAFAAMQRVDDGAIAAFFERFATHLADDTRWRRIQEVNERDVAAARARGRSTTRLSADEKLRRGMIEGLRGWIGAASRRDQVLERVDHDGWRVELVGAALGVVAFVFEGRPNVLADATGVLRGGNTVVFRIGSDALRTAEAIMAHALAPALVEAGLPEGAAVLLASAEHAAGWALFSDARLSLAVARGSGPTVAILGALARGAGVPVSLHGTGGAWIVASARVEPAVLGDAIVASLDRKVCNTLNTLCLPRARARELVPVALDAFARAGTRLGQGYKLHVLEGSAPAMPADLFTRRVRIPRAEGEVEEAQAERLPESDLGREWEWEQTPEVTLALVDDTGEAARLFNRYSPRFIASLVGGDAAEHARFWAAIDAPFVGDAGTRWVDGQRALDKPELGLSNWQHGRLFARGGILAGDGVYTVRTRAVTKR
jgi:glutamate-5-semialdehyde dehydrogenase